MKTSRTPVPFLPALPSAGLLVAVLCAPAPVSACESCAQAMALRLLASSTPSAHAAEMTQLIARSDWEGREKLLQTIATVQAGAAGRTVAAADRAAAAVPPIAPAGGGHPFQAVIDRDRKLGIWETSYVPQDTPADKAFTLTLEEGDVLLGNGIVYSGFTVNESIPGPTIVADEGEVIELTVQNKGGIPHGASIHAAYTQTSKYLGRIDAGQSRKFKFRATFPGVYMYHCAPGGHAIPMHTLNGQYGMLVVKPRTVKFRMDEVMGRGPDLEIFLLQHELYASGKDAIEGRAAYVMFNGRLFRYVDSPIKARPGDFVRIYFLNAGPNLVSTFHLVGIIWDYAYWQGTPTAANTFQGGQTVTAGPSDSWIVDFRVPPDEGGYLMVTHAFGSTTRGAIGILQATRDVERSPTVLAEGPKVPAAERETLAERAVRRISPFRPGTEDERNPFLLPAGQKKLQVQIIGNSFWPKVAVVPPGTEVEWVNEDVFTFFKGEFSGVHDVVTNEAPEHFSSPLLGHAERFSLRLNKPGTYEYYCTPHPYMEGRIIVRE